MSLSPRRVRRWLQRTLWMLRAVAADFGLSTQERRGAAPLWLRDNPFLQRALRGEARRLTIYWRIFWLVLLMGAVLLAGLYFIERFPRPLESFAHATFGVPAIGVVAMLLPLIQILAVVSVRAAVSPSLLVEARRQTLDALLGSPMRPAEMLLGMTIGPSAVALAVALAGLPIYVLVMQMGGMDWDNIAAIYLLLAWTAFAPPSYALPALAGGAAAAQDQAQALRKAQQGRLDRPQTFSGPGVVFFWFFYLSLFWSHMPGGGFIAHLTAPLPIPRGPVRMFLIFTWPYAVVKMLTAPLPFYGTALPPLLYFLPLAAEGKISSMLATSAALTASSAQEIPRTPLFRRHAALTLWLRRAALLCAVGYAWRPCVAAGDTAMVLGRGAGWWDEAGLLTLFCGAALLAVHGRTVSLFTISRGSNRLRSPRYLTRWALRKALRPLRAALLLFCAACLLAWDSPFHAATVKTLENITLATVAILVFGVGAKALFSVWRVRWAAPALLPWLMLLGLPILPLGALWLPGDAVDLAAASPIAVWLSLFPVLRPWLQLTATQLLQAPGWPFGARISFAENAAATTVAGLILTGLAYALQNVGTAARRTKAEAPASAAPVTKSKPAAPAARVLYADKTALLMTWIRRKFDNPLFIREIRSQTRSGTWLQAVRAGFLLFMALQAATIAYPDVMGFMVGGIGWLHFFETSRLFSALTIPQAYAALAGAMLTVQAMTIGLRNPMLTEAMLMRDQQRGILGAILLTPLKTRQIFWGMLFGQSALAALAWFAWSLALLILNLEAALTVGVVPAIVAWIVGQVFIAVISIFGAAMGGAMATHLIRSPNWKGAAILLTLLPIMGVAYLEFVVFGDYYLGIDPLWMRVSAYLLTAAAAMLPLTILAGFYGDWRIRRLRGRDIAFGDSLPR